MIRPLKVSIVIPAFNEEKLLGETLAHIRAAATAFEARGWEVENVVCNNNSTDRTPEIATAGGARVVFEPVNQIGRARNTGAQAASGDWLVFIDADSRPSRELLEEVAQRIVSGNCLAGGVTVSFDDADRLTRAVTEGWNWLSRACKWMAGSFIFVRTEAFREVGGFNPDLFVAEEIDLSRRLKPLARKQRKEITILHRHPLTTSGRKLHLYKRREHLGFLLRLLFSGGRSMRDRATCFLWYDGRR